MSSDSGRRDQDKGSNVVFSDDRLWTCGVHHMCRPSSDCFRTNWISLSLWPHLLPYFYAPHLLKRCGKLFVYSPIVVWLVVNVWYNVWMGNDICQLRNNPEFAFQVNLSHVFLYKLFRQHQFDMYGNVIHNIVALVTYYSLTFHECSC